MKLTLAEVRDSVPLSVSVVLSPAETYVLNVWLPPVVHAPWCLFMLACPRPWRGRWCLVPTQMFVWHRWCTNGWGDDMLLRLRGPSPCVFMCWLTVFLLPPPSPLLGLYPRTYPPPPVLADLFSAIAVRMEPHPGS